MNPIERVRVGQTKLSVTRLGLGGAALGNLYQSMSDDQAYSAVNRALDMGIRYIDTAPLYGVGLSESRIGKAIHGFPRNELTISTKVGRLLRPKTKEMEEFVDVPPLEPYFDYSRNGILESYRRSLERLGVSRTDILLIHDPDDHLEQAIEESYPALDELRTQGEVTAIGVGMNDWKKELLLAKKCKFDCLLLAGRYTLLEQEALVEFLPYCQENGISVIVGGPFNSGILASNLDSGESAKYNYQTASSEILEKARRIKHICDMYSVSIKAAALQFVLAHPAIVSVIPGSRSPAEAAENFQLTSTKIPSELWENLKKENLIARESPTPIG
jgi:D-threo-aldose 1-dehydrogenase